MSYRIPVPQGGVAPYGSAATARVGGQQRHQNQRYASPVPNYGHHPNMSPPHHAPQQVYTAYSPQPASREQRVPTLHNLQKINANFQTSPNRKTSSAERFIDSINGLYPEHTDTYRGSVVSSRRDSASASRDTFRLCASSLLSNHIANHELHKKRRVSDGSSVLKAVPDLAFGTSNDLALPVSLTLLAFLIFSTYLVQ